jgi:spermidine synthase
MIIKKYILEVAIFLSGGIVMIFEIAGSRVIGPYFGTSIFVWTSLIGIILGSLSLGYYYGGRIADKRASFNELSLFFLLAACLIFLTLLIKDSLLSFFQASNIGVKSGSFLSAIILFAPASVILGIISPYAVKLKLKRLETSGKIVGNLYALSTLGSICGTFLAGFYLIPKFGTSNIIFSLVLTLFILSFSLSLHNFKKRIVLLILILFAFLLIRNLDKNDKLYEGETAYNHVEIEEYRNLDNEKIRMLKINTNFSSAMYVDRDDLVFNYTKYYNLAEHFVPDFKKALMIGGAAYSYPKEFLKRYEEAEIDVVEIDPGLTELAKKYFNLKEDKRLKIIHEDGRTFINRTKNKYDVIYGDAFKSQNSLPFQLTTKEAVKKKYDILNDKGVVILNIISSIEGETGLFLRAEYKTYKEVFPFVYLFPVYYPNNGKEVQNIILVAVKTKETPVLESNEEEIDNYLKNIWKFKVEDDVPALTDDYAPVDFYINKTII